MGRILEFNVANTTIGDGTLSNVVGPDWSVVRNTPATHISDSDGLLKYDLANFARIQDSKMLIEGVTANQLRNSQDFASGGWSYTGASTTANQFTSPDGTLNASKLIASADTGNHRIRNGIPVGVVTGQQYTNVIIAKSEDYDFVTCAPSATTNMGRYFNLLLGDSTIDYANGVDSFDVEDWGNGWFKCTVVITANGTANITMNHHLCEVNGDINFTGDGVQGVQLFAIAWYEGIWNGSYVVGGPSEPTVKDADVITNTVPVGTAPITMTTWIDGVSDGGQVVNQGDPITMLDGTTSIEIDDSAVSTTTIEIEWIDSISAAATGNKIYRDDVEIADIANGIQTYPDDTAEAGTTYKYEVQVYSATEETTQEVTGVNTDTITTA